MKRDLKLAVVGASMLALSACATDRIVASPVPAARETAAMTGQGDTADDPAIWVNPRDAARSLILGTNKDQGVYVYDLKGAELQRLLVGLVNNVDLRGTLAVASNDQHNALSWFRINGETLDVAHIGNTPVDRIEPYGVCAGMVGGVYQVGVTYKDGAAQVWSVADPAAATIAPVLTRTIKLRTQVEGCVFDDVNQQLFIAEENAGLWVVDLASPTSAPVAVDMIKDRNGLAADVEGVAIWKGENGAGYVVASAQVKDRFVVYDLKAPYAVRGVFTVAQSADGKIGAVTHTDGLDIVSDALPDFPRGIVVVQDDANPVSEVNQNFKIVDWREVERALGLPTGK